jgi:hypothetical protein
MGNDRPSSETQFQAKLFLFQTQLALVRLPFLHAENGHLQHGSRWRFIVHDRRCRLVPTSPYTGMGIWTVELDIKKRSRHGIHSQVFHPRIAPTAP